MNPRTGQHYDGDRLDAGAKRLGLGGVLLEDDTPDLYEREGLRGRPAAMMAAGNPENARMPEESSDVSDIHAQDARKQLSQDGGASASPPSGGGDGGAGGGASPTASTAPTPPVGQAATTPDQYAQYPVLDRDTWIQTLGDFNKPKAHKVANPSSPGDYNYPTAPDPKDPRIREMIVSIANKHGVPPELMMLKAHHESGYDHSKRTPEGAAGILQVKPSTAKEYGVQDPHTLEGNIEAATRYMSNLLERSGGNPVLAEAAYFGGGSVISPGNSFGPKTMDHVKKLLPGVDDALLRSRYPANFASDPYVYWRYMYPYGRWR